MSAHALSNLLNKLRKRDKMRGLTTMCVSSNTTKENSFRDILSQITWVGLKCKEITMDTMSDILIRYCFITQRTIYRVIKHFRLFAQKGYKKVVH